LLSWAPLGNMSGRSVRKHSDDRVHKFAIPRWRPSGQPVNRHSTNSVEEDISDLASNYDQVEGPSDGDDHWGKRFVICEDHPVRLVWSFVVFFMLIYTGTLFPYNFSFVEHHIPEPIVSDFAVVEALVDALFWIDLIANFFFTYEDEATGREVDSLRLIVKHYLTGLFTVNFLACLPDSLVRVVIHAFVPSSAGSVNKMVRLFRLQRLSRLARFTRVARVARCHNVWRRLEKCRSWRVINLCSALAWVVHILACGWYMCAAWQASPALTWVGRTATTDGESLIGASPLNQWCYAVYFVLTVCTTVGFGDISAESVTEVVYVCFTMVVGAIVHSIMVSEVINVVTTMSQHDVNIHHKKALVEAFADHADIGHDGKLDLTSWVETMRRRKPAYDREEMRRLVLSGQMPEHLIKQLPTAAFNKQLLRNSYLHACIPAGAQWPPCFPLLLAVSLSQRTYTGEEIVYQVGDQPFNVFLILDGTFACVARPSEMGGVNEAPLVLPFTSAAGQKNCAHPGLLNWTNPLAPLTLKPQTRASESPGSAKLEASWGTSQTPLDFFRKRSVQSQASKVLEEDTKPPFSPYQLMGAMSYFGDFEIHSQTERKSSVRCESASGTALLLSRQDLSRLVDEFPSFVVGWRRAAAGREGHRQRLVQKLHRPRTYRHFAAWLIQRHWRKRRRRLMRLSYWMSKEKRMVAVPSDTIFQDSSFAWPPLMSSDSLQELSTTVSSSSLSDFGDDMIPFMGIKSRSSRFLPRQVSAKSDDRRSQPRVDSTDLLMKLCGDMNSLQSQLHLILSKMDDRSTFESDIV